MITFARQHWTQLMVGFLSSSCRGDRLCPLASLSSSWIPLWFLRFFPLLASCSPVSTVRPTECCSSCVTCSYLMQEFLSSFLHVLPSSQDCQNNCNLKVALSPLLPAPFICSHLLSFLSLSHLVVMTCCFILPHIVICLWLHATGNWSNFPPISFLHAKFGHFLSKQ